MFEQLQKKLSNVYLFFDLTKMTKKIPKDFTRVMDLQSRRLQKLVKKVVSIKVTADYFVRRKNKG